ncbi:hypothetical protein DP43_5409 [Burkholderia pseudomallei]|nr:hypothetical protein DP43_5409 [Burkholderia pseudomallei]
MPQQQPFDCRDSPRPTTASVLRKRARRAA